ncbi:hypothetical protein ACIBUY_25500 [Streptomyces sp. NPDC050085]|uniref:hypothetical protein n=1 Tax=Streptomyces sp. NPDC050085 TaxID=3365600 RepID=UPI0037BC34A9
MRISLRLELPRVTDSNMAMGQVARAVLAAIGAPVAMSHDLAETTRVAAQYLVNHSAAPAYQLVLSTDEDGVTIAVTDYVPPVLGAEPAWQAVPHRNGTGSGRADRAGEESLQFHRSPDGHMQLKTRSLLREPDSPA